MTANSCASSVNEESVSTTLSIQLDIDLVHSIDHHLSDPIVRKEVLQRTESKRLIDHLLDDALALFGP